MLFLYGLVLIASNTMSEAFSCRPLSALGYAIYNKLLGAHGWSRVRVLAQKTSVDKMLDKIKRCVGQMVKAHKVRIEPKMQASPQVLVLASRLERLRVLMSCAWTILFVMACIFFGSRSGIASWTGITVVQIGIGIWMAGTST
jgi:hypothetical protein